MRSEPQPTQRDLNNNKIKIQIKLLGLKYEALQQENYYHIFNQGNNKENIFLEEKNYFYFLELLKKYIIPVASVLSYCLLKNHFHLLVCTRNIENEKDISKAFSNLFNAYTKAINKQYQRTGSLFRDRFKRIKIEDENYLRELVVYINLNPIYHHFTDSASNYKHSSYLALISDKPTLLEREMLIDLFGNKENFIYTLNHKKTMFDEKMEVLVLEQYRPHRL